LFAPWKVSCAVQIVWIIPEELMKGVSYARFSTTLCLAGGFVKRRWPPGKANTFKAISDKNSQSKLPRIANLAVVCRIARASNGNPIN